MAHVLSTPKPMRDDYPTIEAHIEALNDWADKTRQSAVHQKLQKEKWHQAWQVAMAMVAAYHAMSTFLLPAFFVQLFVIDYTYPLLVCVGSSMSLPSQEGVLGQVFEGDNQSDRPAWEQVPSSP